MTIVFKCGKAHKRMNVMAEFGSIMQTIVNRMKNKQVTGFTIHKNSITVWCNKLYWDTLYKED